MQQSSTSQLQPAAGSPVWAAEELRALCRSAGADDVGFVEIERPGLVGERPHLIRALPGTRALVAFVCRMARTPLRSPARSVANLEFHHTGDAVNEVGRRIVAALQERGVRALSPSMGFPMEMEQFPGRIWVVSHKLVAQEAGLGVMGIHRNLIHPVHGNFVLLGTVLIDAAVDHYDRPLDANPCLSCKLCVAACPVGAIGADGHFDFSACYTHNYREFMSGFTDWTEQVAGAKSATDYRRRVRDTESVSMWQSLSFGANYKAAYCMAVCPAGEDVIGPFAADRPAFVQQVVKPLQAESEPVYALPGSDAAAHVRRRFPHKQLRLVGNALRPRSVREFLDGLPLTFQRGQAGGLDAVYHFRFTGAQAGDATVAIRDRTLSVRDGLHGRAHSTVTADGETWLGYLAGERSLVWALLRRRVRIRGRLRWLRAFARCFP